MEKVNVTIGPSQWVNILWFLLAAGSGIELAETQNILFVIPIIIWLWKYLAIECWQYHMNEDTETLLERKGVFSVQKVEIQYFRIKSIRILKPFFMRLFGLSIVEVITSEPFKPYLRLYAIPNGEYWAQYLKEMAKYWRLQKGVKETDFHRF